MQAISLSLSQRFKALQKENTQHCGDWLLELQSQGFNQTQLAQKLNANRQVIGRYLKAARERKPRNRAAEISPARKKVFKPARRAYVPEKAKEATLSWNQLLSTLMAPQNTLMIFCIFVLSGYLVQQGIIFFGRIESSINSQITNAIISETVPLVSAACFAMSIKKVPRFLMGLLLAGSIIGMGFFMHDTIQGGMLDKSGVAEQYHAEKVALVQSITALSQMLDTLPANFVSKKQEVVLQMNKQRQELASLSSKISSAPKKIQLASNATFSYGVWLRIAAMLLNAFLVHQLMQSFQRFRFNGRLI